MSIFFADDTILFAPGSTPGQAITHLQSAFKELQLSLINHKLVLNADKTKYVIVHFHQQRCWVSSHYNSKWHPYYSHWLIEILRNLAWQHTIIQDSYSTANTNIKNQTFCIECLSSSNHKTIVQATFMSVLDYGDILYCHAAPLTLHQLNSVYHSALRFITNDSYHTHHCSLY